MSHPTPANPGTQITDPLVTPEDYTIATGDTNYDVTTIADATELICERTRRTLVYGQFTETLALYKNGMVYPSAYPIDITQPISTGGDQVYNPSTDNSPGSIVQGIGIWIGFFTPLPQLPYWLGVIPPQDVVTYYGGYTPDTAPVTLKRAIAKVAWFMNNPVRLQGLPTGARSVSIGGVSMAGDLSSMTEADSQLRRDIRKLRHPMVKGWQT